MNKESKNIEPILFSFRQGTQSAFTTVFHTLYPSLCYYTFRITRDLAASEDISEESFLKIWDRRERFTNIKVLKSYLYTTARNAAFKWLKDQARETQTATDLQILSESSKQSILEELVHAEVLREIYSTLDSLPTECRKIMKMLYVEGKTVRRTAEELKLSISTIKNQKTKGLTVIRKNIK